MMQIKISKQTGLFLAIENYNMKIFIVYYQWNGKTRKIELKLNLFPLWEDLFFLLIQTSSEFLTMIFWLF